MHVIVGLNVACHQRTTTPLANPLAWNDGKMKPSRSIGLQVYIRGTGDPQVWTWLISTTFTHVATSTDRRACSQGTNADDNGRQAGGAGGARGDIATRHSRFSELGMYEPYPFTYNGRSDARKGSFALRLLLPWSLWSTMRTHDPGSANFWGPRSHEPARWCKQHKPVAPAIDH
jgi:hypothetical protein